MGQQLPIAQSSSGHQLAPQEGETSGDTTSVMAAAVAVPERGIPLFAWPLLAVSVMLVSSSAAVFDTMRDVPPFTLSAWRTQVTALLLLLPACYQLTRLDAEDLCRFGRSWWLMLAAGFFMALHFACWVWALQHTSLAHCLFILTSAPLVFAIAALVMRQPISRGEVGGTLVGTCGALVLSIGGRNDKEVSMLADAGAVLALLAFIVYFSIGKRLCSWAPLFAYMFVITGSAAIVGSLGALLLEGSSPFQLGPSGVFGWLHPAYLGPISWLAAGPSFIGHTSFNFLLRWLHPLHITLPQTINPILGSLLGWALGVAALPTGMLTYLGGATLIAATVIVLTSANAREARKRREEGLQPGSVPVVITKEGAAGFREGDSSSRFWDEDGEDVELAQLSAPDQTARGGNEDLEPPAAMSLDVQDGSQQQPEGNSHSRPSWFRRWFTALQRPAWNRGVLDPMEREDQALISWRPNTIAANRTTH